MGKGIASLLVWLGISTLLGCASNPQHHPQSKSRASRPLPPASEEHEDPEAYSTSDELSARRALEEEGADEKAWGRGAVSNNTREFLGHVKGVDSGAQSSIKKFGLQYFPEMYQHWINYLSVKDRERFTRHIRNGERYFPVIKAILQDYGVPVELFFVGLIESGYHLGARSHASAVGPWQFIKGTALRYGLRVDRQVDERKDIVKATQAAASYFRDLYNIFGSWELALCAYNAGEYGVIRAIRRGNTRSYVELVRMNLLPKETIYYVPKVAAAMELLTNAKRYGLPDLALDLKSPPDEETLRFIAEVGGRPMPAADTTGSGARSVRVGGRRGNLKAVKLAKRGKSEREETGEASERNGGGRAPATLLTHKVRKGEGLHSIADKYGVDWPKIKALNNLKTTKVMAGQRLRLPFTLKRYVVRRGDNLKDIAARFNTTIVRIVEQNGLKTKTIYPRQEIVVPIAYDM